MFLNLISVIKYLIAYQSFMHFILNMLRFKNNNKIKLLKYHNVQDIITKRIENNQIIYAYILKK